MRAFILCLLAGLLLSTAWIIVADLLDLPEFLRGWLAGAICTVSYLLALRSAFGAIGPAPSTHGEEG